jgi:hypothetical protein
MTNGHVVANDAWILVSEVQHGIVLDVRVVADDDPVDIAAQHGVIPDARMISEGHVAKDHGAPGDENIPAQPWVPAQKSVELFFQLAHAFVNTLYPLAGKQKLAGANWRLNYRSIPSDCEQ